MPSSPKSRSINSLTSLPRSPIRAITFISAFVFLANIPSSVLFPTPEPANIPIRCPLPMVSNPSTAFTPKVRVSFIISLFKGSGGAASAGYVSIVFIGSPSMGSPSPLSFFPNSSSPTLTENFTPRFST